MQHGKPIYFASRSLTKVEENYQNLERETLATIWGMEHFHYFLYGKEFTLETDQKPLTSIYKKHIVDVSQWIHRLIICSLPNNFQVVYVPSTNIPVAAACSNVSPGKGKVEENYQNLERETLATIWGMEHFHYFLYGKEFTLETDQKPLTSIYKKHIVDVSQWIHRLIICSLPNNFQVVYVPSTNIPVAAACSNVSPGKGKVEENYQNLEKRNTCHHLGNGTFPLLSIWKGIHPRN